ncbi:MAG TPA: reverse transcriptase family protein [Tissierellaceae bacterium]
MEFIETAPSVSSIETLEAILNVKDIRAVISNKSKYYIEFDVKGRKVNSVKEPLLSIHKKIRSFFLKKVNYPDFLFGGILNKDYLSNSKKHLNKNIILSEDIKNFYPSISQGLVKKIYQHFFKNPPDVAKVLAELCCINGSVVTGSSISSDIANLVFYDVETEMVCSFESQGLNYTRYIDDITISTDRRLTSPEIKEIKEKVYAMLTAKGFGINRKKSKLMSRDRRMAVHGVIVNNKDLNVSSEKKSNLRAALHHLELRIKNKESLSGIVKNIRSIKGRIDSLKRSGYKGNADRKLQDIVRLIDEQTVKKYIRKIRRVDTKKGYQRMLGNISVFKNYSSKINAIIKSEKKNIREKIF